MYFIAKIALYFQGIIDFHPMENFALLIFILLPISMKSLNTVRHIVVFVAAAWLLHYDSYLPPLDRLWAQAGQLMQFELSYLVELLGRFLSFQAILGLLALCGAYFILSKFVRVSVFVVIAMIYISMPMTTELPTTVAAEVTQQQPPTEVTASKQPQITEINDASLNTLTADFFSKEASRRV
ncbi:cellulose biosynthesis protein BcsG, partial [Vibrio alginolyticus]